MLVPFATIVLAVFAVTVFLVADFGMSGPAFKVLALRLQGDLDPLAGLEVRWFGRAEFFAVGQVNFDADAFQNFFRRILDRPLERVAFRIVSQNQSCTVSRVVVSFAERQFRPRLFTFPVMARVSVPSMFAAPFPVMAALAMLAAPFATMFARFIVAVFAFFSVTMFALSPPVEPALPWSVFVEQPIVIAATTTATVAMFWATRRIFANSILISYRPFKNWNVVIVERVIRQR